MITIVMEVAFLHMEVISVSLAAPDLLATQLGMVEGSMQVIVL